jgi:hypothetical protein
VEGRQGAGTRWSRYTITAKGRGALAAWLAAPGEGLVLESEQVLEVIYAEHGSTGDLRRILGERSCDERPGHAIVRLAHGWVTRR